MAVLVATQYSLAADTITMQVVMSVDNQNVAFTITAAEQDLIDIAAAAGRSDWSTADCCTYANNVLGSAWQVFES